MRSLGVNVKPHDRRTRTLPSYGCCQNTQVNQCANNTVNKPARRKRDMNNTGAHGSGGDIPHSNSLYFCWSCRYYAVSCKQHDQHPIHRPCDQPSDQHPFLPRISFFLPHMTNNVTNSPRYPRIYYSLRG